MDAVGRVGIDHAVEDFAADFRKHGVGDHGIDEAGAALEFGAALANEFEHTVVVGEGYFVVFLHAFRNTGEVELDDALEHILADRVERHDDKAVEQRIRKDLRQRSAHGLFKPLGAGHEVGVLAHADDNVLGGIAREDDDGVFEVDIPSLGVLHPAFVKNLEEDLMNVGMGLLDFVEEDDAVGPAADGFGEDAAFAVADVSRGRAFEGADGMGLLELAHVDGD